MTPSGPYRHSTPPERSERLAKPALGGAMRGATVLGAAAATSIAGAAMLGSVELAVLAGVGALAAALDLVRAGRLRSSHRRLVGFLGTDRVRCEDEAVLSLDGARRVRCAPRSTGVRFEVLTIDGRHTLRSYRAEPADDRVELDALPLEVHFARVHGRCLTAVCFDGSPPELGGAVTRRDARWLRVSRFARGVLVERLDAFGEVLGDTWHPDPTSAGEQIAIEYGPHAGPLRTRPPRWDEPVRPPAWQ